MASIPEDTTPAAGPGTGIFEEPRTERRFPAAAVGVACLVIVVLVAVSAHFAHKKPDPVLARTPQPLAAYASKLALDGIEMSESTSLAGGKSTYIDGHLTNHGPAVVSAVIVQAVFANDTGMPPQLETEPLSLIRTREPYVDTQPVSAAPLLPGASADFRLIFENLNTNWNGQRPEIRIIQATTR